MTSIKLDQRVAITLQDGSRVAGIVSWFTPDTIGITRFDTSFTRVRRSQVDRIQAL